MMAAALVLHMKATYEEALEKGNRQQMTKKNKIALFLSPIR